MDSMKLSTVANENEGQLVYGSPKYPMWVSDEPDIYVTMLEYSQKEYEEIRRQADDWIIEVRTDEEDDHGYSQTNSKSERSFREIEDNQILVKDGFFYGIIDNMSRNRDFYKRVYVSVNTATANHGLWRYHDGHSSDNSSGSDDIVYYLRRKSDCI